MDDVYNIKEWEGDLVDSDPILLSFKISTCLHVFFFPKYPNLQAKTSISPNHLCTCLCSPIFFCLQAYS